MGLRLFLPERESPRGALARMGCSSMEQESWRHRRCPASGGEAFFPRLYPCDSCISLPFSLCWPLAPLLGGATPVELAVRAFRMRPLRSWLGRAGVLLQREHRGLWGP